MKEVSKAKFYVVKYFFLAFALLQASVATVLLFQFHDTPRNRAIIVTIFLFSVILFSIQVIVNDKIKRVAISKKKVIILNGAKRKSYSWSEVKEIKFFALLNLYSLKIKGKTGRIYFLPNSPQTILGVPSSMPEFLQKKISKA
jgi:hypothetical protein